MPVNRTRLLLPLFVLIARMLPLGAIDAGYYTDEEIPVVRAFAEKVLTYMGAERKWIGNFASESVKAETANVVIQTEARKVDGGWLVSGTKSLRLPRQHRRLLSRDGQARRRRRARRPRAVPR